MISFKSILSYLFAFSMLCFTSCSHYYYAPNEGALLALNEKNDVKVSIGGGTGGGGSSTGEGESSISLQGGYSPVKHIGIQSSYFSYKDSGTHNDVLESGNGYISNVAFGTYYLFPFKENRKGTKWLSDKVAMQRSFLIDLYGGYAKGKVNNYYESNTSSHFDFNKRFVQLGLHWQGRVLGIDFTSKFGNLDYSRGIINGKISEDHLRDVEDVESNDSYDFREHSFRVHVGIRHIRLFMTSTVFNSSKLKNVKFIDNTVHLGMILELDEFFRKREANPKETVKTFYD